MLTVLALCLACESGDLARPLDPYSMTVDEARTLHGSRVEVFVESGCPVDVGDGLTVVGAFERDGGVSRAVYLAGEHHDIDPGDTVTVTGVLRVVEHAEATVGGVRVPAWTEIRVEQCRPGQAR